MSQKLKLERLKKTDLFIHVIHQMVLYVKFQDKPYDKGILGIKFNKEVVNFLPFKVLGKIAVDEWEDIAISDLS